MKNSSFILFLIIFLSFSSYGSSTVNWANTPWNYDDRYVRVSLDSGDIEISNVHLDRFAWFGLWTVENISTLPAKSQYLEVTFIDPYQGENDNSGFFMVADLATTVDTKFGVFTSDKSVYYLDAGNDEGYVWETPRTAGMHTMAMRYSTTDNSVEYYFDGDLVYTRYTTNTDATFDIDDIGLAVHNASSTHPFVFTDFFVVN